MKKVLAVLTLLLCVNTPITAYACTVFGAAGSAAAGGGTVLVKNRDEKPGPQYLRLVTPAEGNRYFGLFVSDTDGLRGGINEKGLVAVGLTAGAIPAAERAHMPRSKNFYEQVLEKFNSVDDVITAVKKGSPLFLGPRYLMIADTGKIAYVEIGPSGTTAVRVQENGVLYHTNHYIELTEFNPSSLSSGSLTRYQRIGDLMHSLDQPYDLDTLLAFSNDHIAGPDSSIFRTGSTPAANRTLAVLAFHLPPDESPKIHIRLTGEEKTITLQSSDIFSGQWQVPKQWKNH